MAAATADITDTDTAAPAAKAGGKKKLLIIILAVVLLLVLGGGGAAYFLLKKKAAGADDEGEAHAPVSTEPAKIEAKTGVPPMFSPLEPFTVNLADKDAERYAQIGLTLEIEDNKTGDLVKAYMPAIRNNILLLLANKTAAELLSREGKLKLAREIRREALRPLGIAVKGEDADSDSADASTKKRSRPQLLYPIRAVHFSNIIIQ